MRSHLISKCYVAALDVGGMDVGWRQDAHEPKGRTRTHDSRVKRWRLGVVGVLELGLGMESALGEFGGMDA